jgi:hypothetical protein
VPWTEFKVEVPIRGEGANLSIEELNRMFYERYPRRFFRAALELAAAGYLDPVGHADSGLGPSLRAAGRAST